MRLGAAVWARLATLPAFAMVVPWQCSLGGPFRDLPAVGPPRPPPIAAAKVRAAEVPASATQRKQELPPRRVTPAPVAPPRSSGATLPDEVVIQTVDVGRQAFLRCWTRAQRTEIGPIAGKIRLHLEIDEQGRVTATASDSESAALTRCLSIVARRLAFPAPGRPVSVDLPLMFQ